MTDNLEQHRRSHMVTIRWSELLHEAYLAQALLESEGFYAVVRDENLIRLSWLYRNLLHGVALQVPEADAPLAAEFLNAEFSLDSDSEGVTPEKCGMCGGPVVEHVQEGRRAAFLFWVFIGLPFRRARSTWRCSECHAQPPVPGGFGSAD